MNRADQLVERAANRLQQLAVDFAAQGGPKAKLAEELAEDAAFVRRLKPSLMAARLRGQAPTDSKPAQGVVAPSAPQLGKRQKPKGQSGPNPFLVVGAAFAIGVVVAKMIDWRGHAHPRD
ncbi:MAG: hypothetical protein ABR583_04550 [Gaiellaceae bacterium]